MVAKDTDLQKQVVEVANVSISTCDSVAWASIHITEQAHWLADDTQ